MSIFNLIGLCLLFFVIFCSLLAKKGDTSFEIKMKISFAALLSGILFLMLI